MFTIPGMGHLQPWFDRKFVFDLPLSLFPNVIERLRGTPARLEERIQSATAEALLARIDGAWSIQENAGHLCDLEPLWIRRAEQIIGGESQLAVADLTNRATDDANHNASRVGTLLGRFRTHRLHFVSIMESADPSVHDRTARHPRLGTAMRLIDIAYFTAEHDDHHLARITELLKRTETRS